MNFHFPFTEVPEKIDEIIGQRIQYVAVLVKDKPPFSYPMMGWLQTGDGVWHRFFIDAHVLHWNEYREDERKEMMEEDFEEGEFDGDNWVVRDLMEEFSLKNKTIKDAQLVYLKQPPLVCAQLQLWIEGGIDVHLNDYGDERDPELRVLQ